jgi:hypothetical protein
MSPKDSARRAHRLSRFYPKSWRERYGDEFEAHMEQEFDNTPHSASRTMNIMVKGSFTRAKNYTWRVILRQPGDEKLKAGVLVPIAFIVGIAVFAFSTQPLERHHLWWPAIVLIGVLFGLVIFGVIYDSHRIRTYGPASRLSKDRLIPFIVIEISTLPFIFRNAIGHATLVLYVVVSLDILLFAYKFGWLGHKHVSINGASTSTVRGNSKR